MFQITGIYIMGGTYRRGIYGEGTYRREIYGEGTYRRGTLQKKVICTGKGTYKRKRYGSRTYKGETYGERIYGRGGDIRKDMQRRDIWTKDLESGRRGGRGGGHTEEGHTGEGRTGEGYMYMYRRRTQGREIVEKKDIRGRDIRR